MKKAHMMIGETKVIGNGHNIPLVYWNELTPKEREKFDYLDNPADDFTGFRFKGNVYELDEFMRVEKHNPFFPYFDGYASDSFFSGILVKLTTDDSDFIRAFWYLS